MFKLMTGIIWAIIAIVGVFAFLHFTGNDEIANEAGAAIVRKVGGNAPKPKAAKAKDPDIKAVEDCLGWDISEIRGKEVAKVREGLERINDFIYDLEQKLAVDIDVVTEESRRKAEDSNREMRLLKEQIDAAMKIRNDPSAIYPVSVKGITFSSREELEKALVPTVARFKALKKSFSDRENTPAKGERMKQSINRQLALAKQIREVLKSKLDFAEMTEIGYKVDENDETLRKLEARANTIMNNKPQEITGEVSNEGELLDEMLEGLEL